LFRVTLTILCLLFALPVQARSGRQNQFPHGNTIKCDACHTDTWGITDFGFDAYAASTNNVIDWAELSAMDSDRDGYTNGVELGDPNGTWRRGNAQPSGDFWNPGIKDDNPCGNDILEDNEQCDGGVGNDVTCESLGMGVGQVRCSDLCQYTTTFCVKCGDDKINPNLEDCEGSDLDGESCTSLGYKTGALSCDASCKFDLSDCAGVATDCGDDQLQSVEECDTIHLGGMTCALLGYAGGPLDCSVTCKYDTSSCFTDEKNPGPKPGVKTDKEKIDPEGRTNVYGEGSCATLSRSPSFFFFLLAFFVIRRKKLVKQYRK